jgi:D-3-phosphoglycerate dehydrogenase / 2-oxoglutarate reductase
MEPRMSARPRFTVVFTSDRYELGWERDHLAALPDIEVEMRAGAVANEAEMIAAARDADALLITSRDQMPRAVFAAMTRCKVVSRYAVGLDHIDLQAATDHGVVVTHDPAYCTDEVADHALGMILAANRRLVEQDRDLRAGAWVEHGHMTNRILRGPVPALRLSTVGLIGFGRIGRAVGRRLLPFGVRLIVHDPYVDAATIRATGAEPVELPELLAQSDIVSIHCPLTPETRHMVDERFIAAMKPGAILVNTARGPIAELSALEQAIASGALAGAALDVTEFEPLPADSPLYRAGNVILSPHSAYYSERSIEVVRESTLEQALRVLRGIRPTVVVNPEVLNRVSLRDA